MQEKPQLLFECDSSLTKGVEEQGVLFHSSSPPSVAGDRRPSSVLNYWVVGWVHASWFPTMAVTGLCLCVKMCAWNYSVFAAFFFMEKYCLCGLSVQCLCVCACVCMHMLVFCVCMHVCVCLCFSMRVCLCVCEHARVCGAVCVHVHVLGKWRGIKHLFCVFLNQEALCFRIGQAWTLCVLPWVIQPESGGNGIRSGLWHLTSTHLTCRTTPVCQGVQP